jgi:hypothetical protein
MPAPAASSRPRLLAGLGLLLAPFLLNDFANIFVRAPVPWLVCDYGSQVLSLASLIWLVKCGVLGRGDFRFGGGGWRRAVVAATVATAGRTRIAAGRSSRRRR